MSSSKPQNITNNKSAEKVEELKKESIEELLSLSKDRNYELTKFIVKLYNIS